MNWTLFLASTEKEFTRLIGKQGSNKSPRFDSSAPIAGKKDTDTKGIGRAALFTKVSTQPYDIAIANFKMKSLRLREIK